MDFKIYKDNGFSGVVSKITTNKTCLLIDQGVSIDDNQIGPVWKDIIDKDKYTYMLFPNQLIELDESILEMPSNVHFYVTEGNKQKFIDKYIGYFSYEDILHRVEMSKTLTVDETIMLGDIKVTPIEIGDWNQFVFLIEAEEKTILWTDFEEDKIIHDNLNIINKIKDKLQDNLDYIFVNHSAIDTSRFIDDADLTDRVTYYLEENRKVFIPESDINFNTLYSFYEGAKANNIKVYVSELIFDMLKIYKDYVKDPLDFSLINKLDINNFTKEMIEEGFLIFLDQSDEKFINSFKGQNCAFINLYNDNLTQKASKLGFLITNDRFYTKDLCEAGSMSRFLCEFIKYNPKVVSIDLDWAKEDYFDNFVTKEDILCDADITPELKNISFILDKLISNEFHNNLKLKIKGNVPIDYSYKILFTEFKDNIDKYIELENKKQMIISKETLGDRKERLISMQRYLRGYPDTYILRKYNLFRYLKSSISLTLYWYKIIQLDNKELYDYLNCLDTKVTNDLLEILKDNPFNYSPEKLVEKVFLLQQDLKNKIDFREIQKKF